MFQKTAGLHTHLPKSKVVNAKNDGPNEAKMFGLNLNTKFIHSKINKKLDLLTINATVLSHFAFLTEQQNVCDISQFLINFHLPKSFSLYIVGHAGTNK